MRKASEKSLVYLGDKEQFYNKVTGVLYSRSDAVQFLQSINYGSEERCIKFLELLTITPVKSSEVLNASQKRRYQDAVNDIYELVKPVLGLSKYSTDKASFLYTVDSRGEVGFGGQMKPERFEELLVKNDQFMDIIEREYKLRGELQSSPLSMTIRSLYDLFRTDRDLLFRTEPPQLAYEQGPAFKVLDGEDIEPGEHEAWDEFLDRLDYPETFKAYVWSLFEPENFGRQALWLYGQGNDGKSTIINTIIDYYGRPYTLSLGHKTVDESFFFGQAYGKRLAVYMDCKNLQILQKERIKSLLGRDNVAINDKHDKIFTGQVYAKLFIGSNSYPQISFADRSERTRLLLVKVAPFHDEQGDPDFQDRLCEEMPAFLYSCREAYTMECPRGMSLRVPKTMAEDILLNCISNDSEVIEEFVNERLEFGEEHSATNQKLKQEMNAFFGKSYTSPRSSIFAFEELKKLLEQKGCKSCRPGTGSSRPRGFKGVRIKE